MIGEASTIGRIIDSDPIEMASLKFRLWICPIAFEFRIETFDVRIKSEFGD